MAVTTGQFKVKGGYISTGHYATEDMSRKTGMSDILGQLTDGRVIAMEVKLPGEEPTQEQRDFMALVERNGGVSGWATSVDEGLVIVQKATQK